MSRFPDFKKKLKQRWIKKKQSKTANAQSVFLNGFIIFVSLEKPKTGAKTHEKHWFFECFQWV